MNTLTPDMEIESLEFNQLGFGLYLVPYFFSMLPFLLLPFLFGMVIDIPCHCMLEVYICFMLYGITGKKLL